MTPRVALRLGRVSNLPTVWTNALAGAVLSGAAVGAGTVVITGLALSLFYLGGMWLNDAFDAEIDARERANRPIPQGEASLRTVALGGGAMLAGGLVLSLALGAGAFAAAVLLVLAVLLYDWLHKRTVLSPVIMGTTRFLSYAMAALAAGALSGSALLGAFGLFAWIVGLTFAAKQEAYDRLGAVWPLGVLAIPLLLGLWTALGSAIALLAWLGLAAVTAFALHRLFRRAKGDVPRAVVTMIAGISLYDAVLIAGAGAPVLGVLAAAGFGLTLALQRVASGT
ncbi:UbiA family prenyltransferase (plasmid) [Roseivivax marinus]|jgi:4-hydroxybenzoate polyprenyltransferase|uniref:UbiA family prenyltransferase n=1 Tax=Roseivivax marinus TaxID=1379903 RepID=UPI001F04821A|nr:UbiA family prenyltransferase [Roseivivax marinus]UMA66780.1 UbiA family prenyltransferase [Roseivivax marinus]